MQDPRRMLRRTFLGRAATGWTAGPWRRAAAAVAGLFAFAGRPAAQQDERRVIVRISSDSDEQLRAFLRDRPIEVLSFRMRGRRSEPASALVLLPRNSPLLQTLAPGLKATIVVKPPESPEGVPRVGEGNRFKDPRVQPSGSGKLTP